MMLKVSLHPETLIFQNLPACRRCAPRWCCSWTGRSETGGCIRRWVGRIAGGRAERGERRLGEWVELERVWWQLVLRGSTSQQSRAGGDLEPFSALFQFTALSLMIATYPLTDLRAESETRLVAGEQNSKIQKNNPVEKHRSNSN